MKLLITLFALTAREMLSAIHLGRIRTEIKKHLSDEMKAIDKLVKKVIAS